ncbi:hypothetical protein BDV23DRAFT_107795 [Aspergillus alliaceus]|uniref:Uncharacterized protein n=1 Tax=Petromyces alliaceus TaxID=209559 RepID=A0A5N7C402_PETAA|nr:hypothetical protein BDV23DRAFT_107795 [Aspergillus alliaceus]
MLQNLSFSQVVGSSVNPEESCISAILPHMLITILPLMYIHILMYSNYIQIMSYCEGTFFVFLDALFLHSNILHALATQNSQVSTESKCSLFPQLLVVEFTNLPQIYQNNEAIAVPSMFLNNTLF